MKQKRVQHSRLRVALLVESSRAYGRSTLSGVAKYIRANTEWSISLQEQSLCDDLPGWLKNWQGDGIITRMENSALAAALKASLWFISIDLNEAMPGRNDFRPPV